MLRKSIVIKQTFVFVHHWPEAPEEMGFLRYPHRHLFYVRVWIEVEESRQVEFFQAQNSLLAVLQSGIESAEWAENSFKPADSCEILAEKILKLMQNDYRAYKVSVSEDDENGAEVEI